MHAWCPIWYWICIYFTFSNISLIYEQVASVTRTPPRHKSERCFEHNAFLFCKTVEHQGAIPIPHECYDGNEQRLRYLLVYMAGHSDSSTLHSLLQLYKRNTLWPHPYDYEKNTLGNFHTFWRLIPLIHEANVTTNFFPMLSIPLDLNFLILLPSSSLFLSLLPC